eukprot:scaffold1525_cov142-Cylindrotheca_fusiformis.AAC.196
MEDLKAKEDVCKLSLTLFDISKNVLNDNKKGTVVGQLATEGLLESACPARSFLHKEEVSDTERTNIQREVLRFLKTQDKWAALGSTLLKSQAFHTIYNTRPKDRTVVALPRTKHGKPYIPLRDHEGSSCKEENAFPLSVSHQFPFVGAALLNTNEPASHLVGLDIVTFEKYNENVYSNEDDFLEALCGSFTEREWACIQANEGSRTNEFYIRWATKEAYTKALGVGLGCEFNSFDISMKSDHDGREVQSCWEIVSSRTEGSYFPGSVEYLTKSKAKTSEYWGFYFLPLFKQGIDKHISGCACVCVGSSQVSSKAPSFQISLQRTNIDSLVEWHR